jgi:hypothetical protein
MKHVIVRWSHQRLSRVLVINRQTGAVKRSTLTLVVLAVVVLVALGSFVHVLGGITKILVVIVLVLAVTVSIRGEIAKRRSRSN